MSAEILNRVWKAAPPNLTSFHRLLLVRLAWYADDSGANCFASVATLAHETGATERGVRNAMSELRGKGLVVVEANTGPNRTNRIALAMEAIEGGLTRNGGASLNSGAGNPEPPCTSPRNGGSANKQERQMKDTSSRGKRESDPRHTPFKEAHDVYYRHVNRGLEASWDGREAKALATFLAANPKWTLDNWQAALQNRLHSDDVNHGAQLSAWIKNAPSFASSALDRYGKPKAKQQPLPAASRLTALEEQRLEVARAMAQKAAEDASDALASAGVCHA